MGLKKSDTELYRKIGQVLKNCTGPVGVVPHENPDGDAIGSAIGLANVLTNSGLQATVFSPNDYPAYYDWFNSKAPIRNFEKNKKGTLAELNRCELLFLVDFNEITRVGPLEEGIKTFTGAKILIDHHPGPEVFCDYTISDVTYSSTAELTFDFIQEIGYSGFIDKPAAEALFAGIMTDTGSFSYNVSDPNTFNVAARLLAYGINADEINAHVYHNFSAQRMKLLGYCLSQKMEILPEFNTVIISITKNELERFDFVPGDTEGFVNYPLSIAGIKFSVLFIEKDGYVKLSLRSKGSFPVNEFAKKHYNGGGHLNASGGESKENLEKTIDGFRQLLPSYLHLLGEA